MLFRMLIGRTAMKGRAVNEMAENEKMAKLYRQHFLGEQEEKAAEEKSKKLVQIQL